MRTLRAIIVIASMWALLGVPLGAVLGVVVNTGARGDVVPPSTLSFTIALTVWGACSGAVFALLLLFAERGGSVESLSTLRVIAWGALGCMSVPIGITIYDALYGGPWSFARYDWSSAVIPVVITGCLGALGAAGTLGLVRRRSTSRAGAA